jgi:thiol-disulfide isomerase/thioredoxin
VPKPENVAPVGKPFPALSFTSLQGQKIDVSGMKGKVVLVDFWATWCGPCRQEIPNLVALYEKYHDQGLEIVGVSLDKNQKALENYIKENKMPWPEQFDGKEWNNEIAKKFAVKSIPCSYLLDRKGVVRHISVRGEQLAGAIGTLIE